MTAKELIIGIITGVTISLLLIGACYFYGIYLPAQISAASDYEVAKGILIGGMVTVCGVMISLLIIGGIDAKSRD